MNLAKVTILCSLLALSACSENNGVVTENGPLDDPANDPVTEAISLDPAQRPELTPLPDVSYDPSLEKPPSTGGVALDDAEVATSEGAGDGGTGGTTGGTGTGGSTTGGDTTGGTAGESAEVDGDIAGTPVPPGETTGGTSDEQFRAGTLTAADYDDQLNPHLYQRYASDFLQNNGGTLDVPYLDLSNRIPINVYSSMGDKYAGVTLRFLNAGIEFLTLVTPPSGTTYLYRDIDALPSEFTIEAYGVYDANVFATINLDQAMASAGINITMPEEPASFDQDFHEPPRLDIMFVIDTTGSMGDELGYLQTELSATIQSLPYDEGAINLGLTFYRDIGDEYVVRAHGFTADVHTMQRTLRAESYDGGGDYPEAMDQALHQAIDANWQADSTRILFLVADAPPHNDKMRDTWNAAVQARAKNIHIVPIAASGVGENAEYLMRSMAAFTNGRYAFLTDDSGYGNPHAEPTVDCYVVTHLNDLMERIMNSVITGTRDEPSDNDIIRRVGNYQHGVCEPEVQTQQ